MRFADALRETGLVAILRGIRPVDAVKVGQVLVDAGFRIIEVPLNSSEALTSIGLLAGRFGRDVVIGAGTVLAAAEVAAVARAGGRLVVAPNMDPEVVAATKDLGLAAVPGVATPTEAFAGVKAGADGLKLFPAEGIAPEIVGAWRAVLPKALPLIAVGGITPDRMVAYRAKGIDGFGIGSALFRPGCQLDDLRKRADSFVAAWRVLPLRG
jgi:2-dehydro-3-deoxyphosphogalactonate aldolase